MGFKFWLVTNAKLNDTCQIYIDSSHESSAFEKKNVFCVNPLTAGAEYIRVFIFH